MKNTYRFDVPVWATVRVVAEDEPTARKMLTELSDPETMMSVELSVQMEEIENFELSPVACFGDFSEIGEGDLE